MSVSAAQALARIPAFPPVAARVLSLLSRDEVAVGDLETLINRDPALASEVLGRANSSLYCLGSRVRTVRHAIAILGLLHLKSAVSAAAMSRYLKALTIMDSLRAWWQHSLATAVVAHSLALGHGLDAGRAYLAGLLHDLGPMALLVAFTADYERLLSTFAEDPEGPAIERVLAVEQYVLGIDHKAAGLYLAAKWRLPDEVMDVLKDLDPDTAAVSLPLVVQTASKIADSLGWGITHWKLAPSIDDLIPTLPEPLQAGVLDRRETLCLKILKEFEGYLPGKADEESMRQQRETYPQDAAGFVPRPDPAPAALPRSQLHPLVVCLVLSVAVLLAGTAVAFLGR